MANILRDKGIIVSPGCGSATSSSLFIPVRRSSQRFGPPRCTRSGELPKTSLQLRPEPAILASSHEVPSPAPSASSPPQASPLRAQASRFHPHSHSLLAPSNSPLHLGSVHSTCVLPLLCKRVQRRVKVAVLGRGRTRRRGEVGVERAVDNLDLLLSPDAAPGSESVSVDR